MTLVDFFVRPTQNNRQKKFVTQVGHMPLNSKITSLYFF